MLGSIVDEDELLRGSSGDEDDDSETGSDIALASNSDEEQAAPMEVVMKEFIAIPPGDHDVEGIENICKQIFKHFNIDLKDFAQLLVGQNYVTTLLKDENEPEESADEEDDTGGVVYGVYSAVNLMAKRDNPSVEQIIKFIMREANKSAEEDFFKAILHDSNSETLVTGLLIKEKVVNIPGVAAGPMMKQLLNDLKDATDKGMSYNFTHFIHIAKMVKLKDKTEYFVDQDDEIIHKNYNRMVNVEYEPSIDANVVFQNEKGKTLKGRAFRRIYVLSMAQLKAFMAELSGLADVKDLMKEAGSSGLKL